MSSDDEEPRGELVTCSVCHEDIGRGPGGLGQVQHAKKHRREFKEAVGRWPESYQEVRDTLGRPGPARITTDDGQKTIWEALTDDEQTSITEAEQ